MKWQTISNITSQISEEAKASFARKLEKDASVEIPNLWSDFIAGTSKHLHNSQSNIIVSNDEKTGSFTCVVEFDGLHEDFLENKKPFLEYALDKYDLRAANYLSKAKNPFTKRILQQKIGDYRMQLASQISKTEAKLIDGRRTYLAIEAIQKLKNATYDNPELYSNHLDDSIIAISSLSLLSQEKDKMLHEAREELAEAAALGTLKQAPDIILNPNISQLWKEHLTLHQRIKLENQANTLIHQRRVMMEHNLSTLSKAHFASILETGKGISGFDNMLHASFSADSPKFIQLKEMETLYKEAFVTSERLKVAPLSEGADILKQMMPEAGDVNYDKKEKIYHILVKQFNEQVLDAKNDPAKFVENLFSEDIPENLPIEQRYLLRKQLQAQKGIPSFDQKYLMKSEKADFLKKIENGNINQIKQTIDSIIGLQNENLEQYGLEIMEEILADNDGELLVHFYANNKLYERSIANAFLEMLPVRDQLFSNNEKKEFAKEVDNNSEFKKWSNILVRSNIQNVAEVNQMHQGIKYLARYYQRESGLDVKKAVSKATRKLISEVYMDIPSKKIQIPKQIIVNNMIQNLDSDYIEANLAEIQKDIINDSINYDYGSSFGLVMLDGISKVGITELDSTGIYAKAKLEETLREGRWKLTPDKKSVYFTYPANDGSYYPLMADKNHILKFDLIDLNNPEGFERQKKQWLMEMSKTRYGRF